MKKSILLLALLVLPSVTFAQSNGIIWSKNLGLNVTWQQTASGDIIKYKNKIIDSGTGWFVDDTHMLCAYQTLMNTKVRVFTVSERDELMKIGIIANNSYSPPDKTTLSDDNLNTLYRITSRHCSEAKAYVDPRIWNRWIYVTRYNTTFLYDTQLWMLRDIFIPSRLIKKWKSWFFAIGLVGGNEQIEFLSYDWKSYIDHMDTLLQDYSEGDTNTTVTISNYRLLSNKKIRVTFSILHASGTTKNYTQDFNIITP